MGRMYFFVFFVFALGSAFSQNDLIKVSGNGDFGEVAVGKTDTLFFQIVNQKSLDLTLNISLGIASENLFLSDTILTIRGNTSEEIALFFQPKTNIAERNYLWINHPNFGTKSKDIRGQGALDSYYLSTRNKHEEELKKSLSVLISQEYKNLGYTRARDLMYGSIDNRSGVVEDIYTGREATFNTRSGANSNSFNTEHTWPQSFYNGQEPERADIHHLFPCDISANSRRANYPFGQVYEDESWSQGGSKLGKDEGGQLVFEVRDAQKGATARAMLYFVLRYENYANFLSKQEDVLREWALTFLPSAQEKKRNEDIYDHQKNKNPFVDHPYFLNRISSFSSISQAPNTAQFNLSQHQIEGPATDASGVKQIFVTKLSYQNKRNDVAIVQVESRAQQKGKKRFVEFRNDSTKLFPGETFSIEFSANKNAKITDTIDVFVDDQKQLKFRVDVQIDSNKVSKMEILDREDFQAYPNPFGEKIFIYNQHEKAHLQLFTPEGRIVFFGEINKGLNEIDARAMPLGHYFALLLYSEGCKAIKLLKK